MTNDLRLGVGACWPFLHDEKRVVAKDLDIAEYTAPAPRTVTIVLALLLTPTGTRNVLPLSRPLRVHVASTQ